MLSSVLCSQLHPGEGELSEPPDSLIGPITDASYHAATASGKSSGLSGCVGWPVPVPARVFG